MDGVKRREFLKGFPLFGAGAVLGLNALSEAGETPKARKLSGADVGGSVYSAYCNAGACNAGYICYCNTGICNPGGT